MCTLIIKNISILILGKVPTQGLDDTSLTAEAEYYINFTEQGEKFCLSLHYNGSSSYFFVNGVKICQFKAKDFELVDYPLCLEKTSKGFSDDNVKQAVPN